MPFSIPLPLGGFTSELASFDERLRSLEAGRDRATVATATGTVSVPSNAGVWQTPNGWPSLTVAVSSTAGVIMVSNITPVVMSTIFSWGISVDGNTPDVGGFTANQAGRLGSTLPLFEFYPLTAGSILALGDHTFTMQVINNDPINAAQVANPIMAIVPI